jgi:hypothetical protein
MIIENTPKLLVFLFFTSGDIKYKLVEEIHNLEDITTLSKYFVKK